jgi:DNA uptake protein ComE-like DNA-binding protein
VAVAARVQSAAMGSTDDAPSRAASRWLPDTAHEVTTRRRAREPDRADDRADRLSTRELAAAIDALTARVEALELRLANSERSDGSAAPNGSRPRERNINSLSFEDLRGLGLTVSEAARLISQRDARGGFKSLDELDELWGLPRRDLAELKRATTI